MDNTLLYFSSIFLKFIKHQAIQFKQTSKKNYHLIFNNTFYIDTYTHIGAHVIVHLCTQ